ncbi:Etoposide induced 2.4 mRNA [Podochytrium sp. JEL0797]|nr:Etoposide induced 2.4 mRNA [Podochytrium sp. JEL0797]
MAPRSDGPAKLTPPSTQPPLPPTHLSALLRGIYDALAIPSVIITIYGSTTIQRSLLKSILLTTLLFLTSTFLLNHILSPAAAYLTSLSFSEPPTTTTLTLPGVSTSTESTLLRIGAVLRGLYFVVWVFPLHAVCAVLNAMWYQAIADRAYEIVYGKAKSAERMYEWFLKRISSEIYRYLLLMNLIIVTWAVASLIPFSMGFVVTFPVASWILAFAAFEYKWSQKGWTVHKKVECLETRWAYFLGFGLPCTLCTFFFPWFIGTGVYAILFPLFIIMANQAHPLPRSEELKRRSDGGGGASYAGGRVRVFLVPGLMSDAMVYLVCGGMLGEVRDGRVGGGDGRRR